MATSVSRRCIGGLHHHQVALVAHHSAHRQPAGARQLGDAPGLGGWAAAPGQADVHVHHHLAHAAVGRCCHGFRRVHGDRHPVSLLHQGAEPVGGEHLVGQQQVGAEACLCHAFDLPDGRAGKAVVPGSMLHPGQLGALVRLDVRAQTGSWQRRSHDVYIGLKYLALDEQGWGLQLVDPHPSTRVR